MPVEHGPRCRAYIRGVQIKQVVSQGKLALHQRPVGLISGIRRTGGAAQGAGERGPGSRQCRERWKGKEEISPRAVHLQIVLLGTAKAFTFPLVQVFGDYHWVRYAETNPRLYRDLYRLT